MSKPPKTKPPVFLLNVLLYREGGRWTAHCLQLDLVECARTIEEAQSNILDVIRAHLEHALEHDNMAHLFHPAPAEYWQLFLRSKPIGRRTLRLHPERSPLAVLPRVTVQESSVRGLAA
jgi:predicted RNase H-like HicB family nuclease